MKNIESGIEITFSFFRITATLLLIVILTNCTIASKQETRMIPMRDGVKLATDLYFPDEGKGPWPLILIRTPNYKEGYQIYGDYYSANGYIVAIQDVRGQNKSEGDFRIWENDKQDGYDAIEWLANQKFCNKKIGMFGGSYCGWATLAAATTKPPHLVTITPIVTPGDPSINHVYPSGVYALTQQLNVISLFKTRYGTGGDRYKLKSGFQYDIMDLPVIDLDKKLFGTECPWWRESIQHKPFDPFWEKADVLKELEKLDLPVFIIGGWFDFGGIGTKEAYRHFKLSENEQIKLLIGPWMHQTIGKSSSMGYDFGPLAAIDFKSEVLRWFDYHLKGLENGIMEEPLVKIFKVDANKWAEGNIYPLPETEILKLHLSSSGKLISDQDQLNDKSAYTTYAYDPGDPTPSIWYDNLPDHQSIISERKDILIFESEPFASDVQIAGPVSADLYASSSAKDTDWFIYYMLIDDKNEMHALGRGCVRARYRAGDASLLEQETIYHYNIDLWHSSFLIHEGWKMRVFICSSAFPHYTRNLNTGEDNETSTKYQTAEQKIYHSYQYPSHVSFSIIN